MIWAQCWDGVLSFSGRGRPSGLWLAGRMWASRYLRGMGAESEAKRHWQNTASRGAARSAAVLGGGSGIAGAVAPVGRQDHGQNTLERSSLGGNGEGGLVSVGRWGTWVIRTSYISGKWGTVKDVSG